MRFTTAHLKANLSLRFAAFKRVKITFSKLQRSQMYLLWLRFRHYKDKHDLRLTDLYKEAFKAFLHLNKIPKTIPKVDRKQYYFDFDEETVTMLDGIRKIALKRNQPISIVIEEALQTYLDLPQNYLGKDLQKVRPIEKIPQ